jgi:diguanylate cyclase (GGDEF)-like protein
MPLNPIALFASLSTTVLAIALMTCAWRIPGAKIVRQFGTANLFASLAILLRSQEWHLQSRIVDGGSMLIYVLYTGWIAVVFRQRTGTAWKHVRPVAAMTVVMFVVVYAGAPSVIGGLLGEALCLVASLSCVRSGFVEQRPSMRWPARIIAFCCLLNAGLHTVWLVVLSTWTTDEAVTWSVLSQCASFWALLVGSFGMVMFVLGELTVEAYGQALIDPLTAVMNRRGLDAHVRDLAAVPTDVGVIAIDIDNFKAINDSHGHAVGDQVIAECAVRLRDSLRLGDVVSRVGGEEFVVLAQASPLLTAQLSERLRSTVASAPFCMNLTVTISVGFAMARGDADAIAEARVHADAALYRAKRNGKNRVEAYVGSRTAV